jgi:hypothetical protein
MRAGPFLTSGLAALCLTIGLTACGQSDDGVGGVSAGEADALNNAAEMLDNRGAPQAFDANAGNSANAFDVD